MNTIDAIDARSNGGCRLFPRGSREQTKQLSAMRLFIIKRIEANTVDELPPAAMSLVGRRPRELDRVRGRGQDARDVKDTQAGVLVGSVDGGGPGPSGRSVLASRGVHNKRKVKGTSATSKCTHFHGGSGSTRMAACKEDCKHCAEQHQTVRAWNTQLRWIVDDRIAHGPLPPKLLSFLRISEAHAELRPRTFILTHKKNGSVVKCRFWISQPDDMIQDIKDAAKRMWLEIAIDDVLMNIERVFWIKYPDSQFKICYRAVDLAFELLAATVERELDEDHELVDALGCMPDGF
jgi:hypothetical protein